MRTVDLRRFCIGSPTGTYGVFIEDEKPFAVCLEPIIPVMPGEYIYRRYDSQRFKRVLFMTMDVPNHPFIEIHMGNTIADTRLCQLIGERFGSVGATWGILGSGLEFSNLMHDRMKNEDEFKMRIINL